MNTKHIFFIFSFLLSVSIITASGSLSHQESIQEKNRHHHQEKQFHQIKEKHHLHHQEKFHSSLHHPINKQHVNHRNHKVEHLIYRDQNDTCSWVCPNNGTNTPTTNSSELQIAYNGSAGLIGVVGKSSNIGLIIGYASNLSALLNGQLGSAIIFDIGSLSIYRINSSQSSNATWLVSRQSFDSYLQNISSLQPLLQLGQESGEKIGFQNISQSLLAEIGGELGTLGTTVSPLDILNKIAQLAPQLNGTLRVFFRGKGSFVINRNLQWFLSVNSALANVFGNASGNWNFRLNLNSLYGARSGIETFLNLLSQIGQQFNLANIFSAFLKIPLTFVRLFIAGFRTAADLFINAVLTIIRFITGGIGSITEVINSILNFAYTPDISNFDFRQIVGQGLKIIENQNRLFNNSADLSNIQKVLEALHNNNLSVNNVNISNILNLLRRINPVDVVGTIFKIISQFLPTRIIPQIIRSFLGSSNITGGVEELAKLFPEVDFKNFSSILQNSNISQILQNVNLTQLFSGINFANLTSSNFVNTIQSFLRNSNLPQFFPGLNLNSSNYLQAFQTVLTNSNITQFLQGLNLNNLTSTDFLSLLQRILPNSNFSLLFPGVNFSNIASLSPVQFFETLLHNINLNQLFSDYPGFFSFLTRIPSIIVDGIRRFISWVQSLNPLETIPNIIESGFGAILGNITNIPSVIGSGISHVFGPIFEPIGPILGPIIQTPPPGANGTSGPTSSSGDTEATIITTTVSSNEPFGISGIVEGYLQSLGRKGTAHHEEKHPSETKSDKKIHHHNGQEKHHKHKEKLHKHEEKHHRHEEKHRSHEEKHHRHEGKHHHVNENLQ